MKLKKFNELDVLIDNPNSWMWLYCEKLVNILSDFSNTVRVFRNSNEIISGEILFILSCDRILKSDDLDKHNNNIVIHESDLPRGKGWSPLSYQIEEGLNHIPITLFEACEELDAGKWYLKDNIILNGSELIDELRYKQASKSFDMIENYLKCYPCEENIQTGEETHYNKRTSNNQLLDVNKSLKEQFDLFRVCDNDNYPAHFVINNQKYILKIGIICLGIQLKPFEFLEFGAIAIPLIIICIVSVLIVIKLLVKKLKIPTRMAYLISIGSTVCGTTAIMATAPVIGAKKNEYYN